MRDAPPPRTSLVRIAAALLPLLAVLQPARADDAAPPAGVTADPCAGVPVQPTAAHKAGGHVYEDWIRDWLAVDWAQRCRYRAENAALPKAGPHRLVLVGDSITEGWREQVPALFDAQLVDRGISGQVSEQMLVRFREDALALSPDVVQLMAGTNDLAGNRGPTTLATIEGNIASMAELARASGVRVLVASIPPAKAFPWRPDIHPADDIRTLNAWLKAYAARQHFTYVDYHAVLADAEGGMKPEYSGDGVHPNAAGYAAMQPVLEAALRKARASSGRQAAAAARR
jgi:lysophospholipase L1-like esterase